MAINVKLPETLVESAKRYAAIEHRSVPKQIEYWSQIGKIAAENPDLPFSVIRDILVADQEEPVGEYRLMETVHLLKSPANAAHIARSIEQYRLGQVKRPDLEDAG